MKRVCVHMCACEYVCICLQLPGSQSFYRKIIIDCRVSVGDHRVA